MADREIKLPTLRKGDEIKTGPSITDHATITGQTVDPLTRQPKIRTSRGDRKVFNFDIYKTKLKDDHQPTLEARKGKSPVLPPIAPEALRPVIRECFVAAHSPYWRFSPNRSWVKEFDTILKDHGKAHEAGRDYDSDIEEFDPSWVRMEIAEKIRSRNSRLYWVRREVRELILAYQQEFDQVVEDSDYLRGMESQIKAGTFLEFCHFDDSLHQTYQALTTIRDFLKKFREYNIDSRHQPEFITSLREYIEGYLPLCEHLFGGS